MSKTAAGRIINDGGRGPIRSPGRRLQTGKYTYWPTEIRGRNNLFILTKPVKLRVEILGGYFVVGCAEIRMYGIIGKTTALALREFAYCFEATYMSYVEEFKPNKFIKEFQQQLRDMVKEIVPR